MTDRNDLPEGTKLVRYSWDRNHGGLLQTGYLMCHDDLPALSRSPQSSIAHPHLQWQLSVVFSLYLVSTTAVPAWGRTRTEAGVSWDLYHQAQHGTWRTFSMSRVIRCCFPEMQTLVPVSPSLKCLKHHGQCRETEPSGRVITSTLPVSALLETCGRIQMSLQQNEEPQIWVWEKHWKPQNCLSCLKYWINTCDWTNGRQEQKAGEVKDRTVIGQAISRVLLSMSTVLGLG